MTIRRHTRRLLAVTSVCAAASLTMWGCGSSARHAGAVGSFQSNPSPAMSSLGLRPVDRGNRSSYAVDTTLRSLHEDGARFFMLDRPSRLHYNIKPY